MKINYNISAMIANNNLNASDRALSNSIERLTSGFKINHAKDDASGLAMSRRMNAQIRSLETANQNSNDGISVIEIAEGALSEIQDMVQRMNELAVKASNGTVSDDDRVMINDEIKQLKEEIERVSETTMYNGEVLLNGGFDVKGYTDNPDLKITTYSDTVRSGDFTIADLHVDMVDGVIDPATFSITLGDNFDGCVAYPKEDAIFVKGPNGFSMEFQVKNSINATAPINLDITGLGAMGLQIGTNEGQELGVRIATVSLRTLGLTKVDCTTEEKAHEFLNQMPETVKYLNEARSRLGAYQNKLEHTVSTLDISEENMTGAYSRLMDADMADEMTEYSKNQVLVQAGTSMVAQANERPSSVLQLLQ